MILLSAYLGILGLAAIIFRKSILGVLVGVQIIFLGATSGFVFSGVQAGQALQGHAAGFFLLVSGATILAIGMSLCIRLFYQRRQINLDELRTLRH